MPETRSIGDPATAFAIGQGAHDRFESDLNFRASCLVAVTTMRQLFPELDDDAVTRTAIVATFVGRELDR